MTQADQGVTQTDEDISAPVRLDLGDIAAWARANVVILAAVGLVLAQLCLAAALLAHSYYRQQDFYFIDWALRSRLNWHFLGASYEGHFMPGGLAVVWVLSKISVYDWLLTATVTIALLALAGLSLARLLWTVFGKRPAILIPLGVGLFAAIAGPALASWTSALQWLPAEIAIAMAVTAHCSYVRTGRLRHAAAAAGWIVFGLLFNEISMLIPLLLLALTSAFFQPGSWLRGTIGTLRAHWRAWAGYAVLTAAYAVLYAHQVSSVSLQPAQSAPASDVVRFGFAAIRDGLLPVMFGGPWHWTAAGSIGGQTDYVYAAGVTPLTQLSWLAAVLLIVASLLTRRRAWRAWAILAAWVVLAVIAPALVTGAGLSLDPAALGRDLSYLTPAIAVLVTCLALAFLPVAGEQRPYRLLLSRGLLSSTVGCLLGVFVLGVAWSFSSYVTDTSSAAARSYIATARVALAAAPAGAVIVDRQVPSSVELPWFGQYADTSWVVGPLAPDSSHITWTSAPSGVLPDLMIMDDAGRLARAQVAGRTSVAPATVRSCWQVRSTGVTTLPIAGQPLYRWGWTIGMSYFGPGGTMAVTFGGSMQDVQLEAGSHVVYVPATGGGGSVGLQLVGSGAVDCVTSMTIGLPARSLLSQPVPLMPVRG